MSIVVSKLCVSFGARVIYDNLNLEVNPGEFVCILGKSGCGKTILLNTILGNFKPNSGMVSVSGVGASNRIGMAYQDFFILPWLTLRENIRLATRNEEELKKYADALKISEFLDLFPKAVSIGTKQRASIVRSLCTSSDILLMDEPLCSVDAITANGIRNELKQICKYKTVLYVTHDINEAMSIASRIICIKDGKISLDDSPEHLSFDNILLHL